MIIYELKFELQTGIARGINIPLIPDAMSELAQQLELLRRKTAETGEELRKIEHMQEDFALQYHECTKINGK